MEPSVVKQLRETMIRETIRGDKELSKELAQHHAQWHGDKNASALDIIVEKIQHSEQAGGPPLTPEKILSLASAFADEIRRPAAQPGAADPAVSVEIEDLVEKPAQGVRAV